MGFETQRPKKVNAGIPSGFLTVDDQNIGADRGQVSVFRYQIIINT
jgi:hypothetical protein